MHDENQPEAPPSEVPGQVIDLEHACVQLEISIEKLEKHCGSVINATLKGDQGATEAKQLALCPLAASLRACVWRIDAARVDINSLMERMEL